MPALPGQRTRQPSCDLGSWPGRGLAPSRVLPSCRPTELLEVARINVPPFEGMVHGQSLRAAAPGRASRSRVAALRPARWAACRACKRVYRGQALFHALIPAIKKLQMHPPRRAATRACSIASRAVAAGPANRLARRAAGTSARARQWQQGALTCTRWVGWTATSHCRAYRAPPLPFHWLSNRPTSACLSCWCSQPASSHSAAYI